MKLIVTLIAAVGLISLNACTCPCPKKEACAAACTAKDAKAKTCPPGCTKPCCAKKKAQ